MTTTQTDKAVRFKELHARKRAFIIPNAWTSGMARLIESKGFEAIATTSAGYAYWKGKPDNAIGLEQTIAHLRDLSNSTSLPISADLENCFCVDPLQVADAIQLAAEAGVVGASIEDSRNDGSEELFDYGLAVDRVRAAAETARALPFPFTLTARCENFLMGRTDLTDLIRRLQGYQDAGANVVFAPGLKKLEDIKTVAKAVDLPLNVIMGYPDVTLTVDMLSQAGVRRVSVGAALARTAFAAVDESLDELLEKGTFTFGKRALNGKVLNDLFAGWPD